MPQEGLSAASSLTVLSFLFSMRGERYCFTSVHFLWKTGMLFNQPQQFILLILIIAEVIEVITKLPPMCTNLLLLHTGMKFSRIKKSTSSKLHVRGITNILYEKYPSLRCRELMSGTPLFFFSLVAYLKAWHRSLNIKTQSSCENVDFRMRLGSRSTRFPNLFLPYFELTHHLPSAPPSCSTLCLPGKTSQSPFWLTGASLHLIFLLLQILFSSSALGLGRGKKENKQEGWTH